MVLSHIFTNRLEELQFKGHPLFYSNFLTSRLPAFPCRNTDFFTVYFILDLVYFQDRTPIQQDLCACKWWQISHWLLLTVWICLLLHMQWSERYWFLENSSHSSLYPQSRINDAILEHTLSPVHTGRTMPHTPEQAISCLHLICWQTAGILDLGKVI